MANTPKETQPLERELATFEREKPRLLREHKGKFALVKGDVVVETFSTFQLAYAEGTNRFGTEPFLVRQVVEKEQVQSAPALSLGLIRVNS